ncbi:proton-dependent oligopeptide transporter family [Artemisia annua]|uniref:Proton-dependent oligopeptide transporter family n=1 Tax=Artemisia annua TaxID=35608 RepID=A0A2U1L0J5_ARTAN|nr:proton-dependent oligopeptide transporter family [Artemisia annua]
MDDNDVITTGVDTPLLNSFVNGAVDYKGRQVLRSNSGYWRSAYFIINDPIATIPMKVWWLLPQCLLAGAGDVLTIMGMQEFFYEEMPNDLKSIGPLYVIGKPSPLSNPLYCIPALGLLALSTLLPTNCESVIGGSSCSLHLQVILFFISLYLVAFAQGGHKPCVQAFGADQFDANDPDECRSKSSFFNWWYFGMCAGPTVGTFVLSYIQDSLSWALGFGIPCIVMGFALTVFLLGTRTYRFVEKTEEKSAFARIGHVFVEAARNRRITHSALSVEDQACGSGTSHHHGSQQFRFLDKALLSHNGSVCSSSEVEEAKSVLRLVPIWASCLAYASVFSQTSTLFTEQGATMDRSIGSSFEIPAATLQSFIGLSIIILIPIYDVVLVPLIRPITEKPSGITMLQRIGTGIFLSIVLMVVAAHIETKRLKTAHEHGLIDDPNAMVPMKIWWLLPQYLLAGAAEVFTVVGLQEFFYDQVPIELRSIGLALYLSVMGIGNFLSSFLISIVEKTTGGNGKDGWISDNVNRGHIDYFYYLLAGISAGAFALNIYAAKSYVYNRVKAL